MKNDQSAGSSPLLIPRRQFLVLGSAAVVGAAASSLSADIVRSALVTENTTPRLSVGFVKAALADFNATDAAPRTLTPASRLRSGSADLAEGVRVKVHGIVRSASAGPQPVSMGLDAMYRVRGHSEEFPFMAWSYSPMTDRSTGSNAAAPFVVPVGVKNPLSLRLFTSAVSTSPGIAENQTPKLQATIDLSPGSERGSHKLRSGLYFLAMTPAGAKAPDWASMQVVPSAGSLPLLKQATLLGYESVPFDYIVISTDRA